MKFMPTGGINENNMLDYLAFDKILCWYEQRPAREVASGTAWLQVH